MKVVVTGGTGHIGTYLIPRLVEAGYEVVCITRGQQKPYLPHKAWEKVQSVEMDRDAADQAGHFAGYVRDLKPDVVMDLICYTADSARQIVEALRGRVQIFIHCGTIWVHGPGVEVPTTEEQPRRPFGDYGIQKAAIEGYLLKEARLNGFPATILHPGHIVGQGWVPLSPAGNFNPQAFLKLARGEELILPNLGMETVHHVHADDVAQAFMQALAYRNTALGESFHVVSPAALTLRGYAEAVARWFGRDPRLCFVPWEEWRGTVSATEAAFTWDHIAHSPNCSIAKAQRLLSYQPRYSSLQAVFESLNYLVEHGQLQIDR
jgi:nucleoside-diphosphate-sugar epimerase